MFTQRLLALSLLISISAASFGLSESLDRIVAIVNEGIVTEKEINDEINFIEHQYQNKGPLPAREVLKRQILDKLILEAIQLQQAEHTGLKVDEAELDHTLNLIAKEQGTTLEGLRQAVEQEQIDYKFYRENIRKQMILGKLQRRDLEGDILVSEQEVDHFLHSPKGMDALGTEYNLGHILIALSESPSSPEVARAQAFALKVVEELKQEKDFKEIANKLSSNNLTSHSSELGFRKLPELPTFFANLTPGMQLNDVQGPIRSPSGFHIIKLLGKRHASLTADKVVEYEVRHILLKHDSQLSEEQTVAKIHQIRRDILAGKDFNAFAKTFSEDLGSKSRGGELGWITKESVVPEFAQTIQKLKVNEISQPFKTDYGWHIAQLVNTREISAEAIFRKKAKQLIRQRKIEEKREAWLRQLREEAYVQVNLS